MPPSTGQSKTLSFVDFVAHVSNARPDTPSPAFDPDRPDYDPGLRSLPWTVSHTRPGSAASLAAVSLHSRIDAHILGAEVS